MDAITFTFVLRSYVLADGTRKILLRITQNRKHKYVDIGYSVKADDWNKERKEVRKSHRLSGEIKMVMYRHLIDAKQTYLISQSQDIPISANEIKR
ncbi:Arm DNA-binding domain-containing protein [Runella sp.]|uniref:Arm DNA-binding domain-containing protein n=1 Tax=Runella sp. TaxID=1960881 RepID=UPI003D123FA6